MCNVEFPLVLLLNPISLFSSPEATICHKFAVYHSSSWFYFQVFFFSFFFFCSVAPPCLTLWDPMNCSTPGLPVHHQLLEFTQAGVHRVSDAIQPSHPWSPPSLFLSRRAGHGGEVWQNVVHWRREWQTSSVFLLWEPHEQYEKAKC